MLLRCYRKSVIMEQKQRAIMDHALLGMLGKMLDGKRVSLYESYPKLFKEEGKQQIIENTKMILMNYATMHNKAVKK